MSALRERILMLVGSYYPQIGGGELLNARHAQLLRAAGYDVEVLVGGERASPARADAFGTPYEIVEARPFAGFSLVPRARVEREIEAFAPSIVYCAGPEPHDVYVPGLAARRGIRSALLYHADFRGDRFASRVATRAYGALAARRFDAVVATTHAYAARLAARGIDPRRIAYAGMGVDTERFAPPPAYPQRERKRALFVGRLDAKHTYKRLDLLLDAHRLLERAGFAFDLTVVGDGERRSKFEAMARDLGGGGVEFAGAVGDEALARAYRESDVLVLPSPSASEGFGMVVLEAYAAGCPAVVNAAAGSAEVVSASGCGAVWAGGDAAGLARAIERVLRDPAPRASVAAKARAFVEGEYAWSAVGKRLAACMESLLRQETPAR